MPAITLKNLPEDLYLAVKKSAEINRRSLNNEILFCIEQTLMSPKSNPEQIFETARLLRKRTENKNLSFTDIDRAKKLGRK